MGTLYFAVNHTKRQVFELGKSLFLDDDPECLGPLTAEYVPAISRQDIEARVRRARGLEAEDDLDLEEVELIDGLTAMGVEDCVIGCQLYEGLYDDYTLVGTRYFADADSRALVGRPFKDRWE